MTSERFPPFFHMYCHTVAAEPGRPLLKSYFEIFLVELPRLYFAFSISVSEVLPGTADLPVLGLSSKSPSARFSVIFLMILERISQRTSHLRLVLMFSSL